MEKELEKYGKKYYITDGELRKEIATSELTRYLDTIAEEFLDNEVRLSPGGSKIMIYDYVTKSDCLFIMTENDKKIRFSGPWGIDERITKSGDQSVLFDDRLVILKRHTTAFITTVELLTYDVTDPSKFKDTPRHIHYVLNDLHRGTASQDYEDADLSIARAEKAKKDTVIIDLMVGYSDNEYCHHELKYVYDYYPGQFLVPVLKKHVIKYE